MIRAKNKRPNILLVYTGGTIGMVKNAETGALCPFDFENILSNIPEINMIDCTLHSYSFPCLLDSSNINPENWTQIASVIEEKYDQYDGFVVLHGTDTMAYTTSALSFMFSGLEKPVIFTGSQLPIGHLRTDAKENLITAIELASLTEADSMPVVREVCLYFQHELYRGNRSTKVNAEQFSAFASPNCPALAHSGVHLSINKELLRQPAMSEFALSTSLSSDVLLLHIYPGMNQEMIKYLLDYPKLKGVILLTYGAGNAPSNEDFIDLLKQKIDQDIPIVNITQCLKGTVSQGDYAVSEGLAKIGVISGRDMTKEAALTKMMYLLPRVKTVNEFRKMFEKDLRGEISAIIRE
ncbi:MAG: type I asparaginase [Flavobacteriales bacterium]|nr:type I asparaginase [Flavobacteriales bacterium]